MIWGKCVEYFVETLTMAAGALKSVLCGLNTLGEPRELRAGVDQLPRSMPSSEAQTESPQCQVSSILRFKVGAVRPGSAQGDSGGASQQLSIS